MHAGYEAGLSCCIDHTAPCNHTSFQKTNLHLALTQVGKEFDALLVDTSAPQPHPVFDVFEKDTMEVQTHRLLARNS